MLEMTNENFARLLRGLTIAVGNRRNRILLYQFLAAEIRALHCSYGVRRWRVLQKRALTFLENCERYTLRSLVRRSAKHHTEVTVDHAKRVFSRALQKLDASQGHNPTLRAMNSAFVETGAIADWEHLKLPGDGGMALNLRSTRRHGQLATAGLARPNDFSTRAINSRRFMSNMVTASPMRYERRRRARGVERLLAKTVLKMR